MQRAPNAPTIKRKEARGIVSSRLTGDLFEGGYNGRREPEGDEDSIPRAPGGLVVVAVWRAACCPYRFPLHLPERHNLCRGKSLGERRNWTKATSGIMTTTEKKEEAMWQTYKQPTSLAETLDLLQKYAQTARLIAGGTDVLVELQRGVKPTQMLIDISKLQELHYIQEQGQYLVLGALTTHNDIL